MLIIAVMRGNDDWIIDIGESDIIVIDVLDVTCY
jgi:hypothetical protein